MDYDTLRDEDLAAPTTVGAAVGYLLFAICHSPDHSQQEPDHC